MDDNFKGKVNDCILMPRNGDVFLFLLRSDGTIVANLQGYVVMPTEEYEQLLKRKP